jgi:5-methylcytosine-specific restriction endonuclease McrA
VSLGPTGPPTRRLDFENLDFLKSPALRRAIHAREGGRCFYCLSRVTPATRCLDHVVPLANFGDNSWRNLVSCCHECNSKKNDLRAADFLRWLHRERRLTDVELAARFRALDALAAGKLRPRLPAE